MDIPHLGQFKRIVIKIGSALLVDSASGELRQTWMESIAADIKTLTKRGAEVLLVSSGSVALGRHVLQLPRGGSLKLEDSQAAAAIGQIALARTWSEVLGAHGLTAGQVLLTLRDTEERRRYLNARATLARLLKFKAIPVINENDTVATSEIRYGDNDRLAARVTSMASADCLVLLSDIDGLYTAPPALDPNARHIPIVPQITHEIEAMAGDAASEFSRGGMRTKIEAGKIATASGAHMVIAKGAIHHPLKAIQEGGLCTWFLTGATPIAARKKWIAGTLKPKGTITVDAGAVIALHSGKSLLPAGVVKVEGLFARGDAVIVRGPNGAEIARGLIAYDVTEAIQVAGCNKARIQEILGFRGRTEMIHRDDLAFAGESNDRSSTENNG